MNLASPAHQQETPGDEPTGSAEIPGTLKLRLAQCETLPSLPGVAMELLQQFREPEVDLKKTAEIIQQDPALTATVLRFVNSAAFGLRREVASLSHAISLLGLNAIRTLALSFSLVRGLRRTDKAGFDYMRFWQRSLLSAMAARAGPPKTASRARPA